MGHVGVAVGTGFVILKHDVMFVDINDDIISAINDAKSLICEGFGGYGEIEEVPY